MLQKTYLGCRNWWERWKSVESDRMGSRGLAKYAQSVFPVVLLLLGLIASTAGCTSAPRYRQQGTRPPKRTLYRKPTRGKVYQVGIASYYGKGFHGKKTANGEIYDMYAITAAHKELPFGTLIKVTNLSNKKAIIVRINDRGPFVKGRILDLSYGAARKLEMIAQGTAKVRIEIMPGAR